MRLGSGPMTVAEFEDALEQAKQGFVVTDHGGTDAMDAALRAVAVAPSAERRAAIRVARTLYRAG